MRTPKTRAGRAEHDISQAVTTVYRLHYRSLVRLAALLVSDLATAEDIVQESFTAWHGMRRTLPEAQIAAATGISTAAVRSHAVRALSALHAGLRPGSCTGSPDGTRPAEST